MQSNTENTVSFYAAFNNQPFWLQKLLRNKMLYRCDWKSRTTFYNKLEGRTEITKPEWAVIRQLFAEHGVDAATGDKIEEKVEA